jgi:hypothetical protein
MRKASRKGAEDMKAEYRRSDLGPLVRGKYTQRFRESSNVVVIEPDLVEAFPNARAVNAALRGLVRARKSRASSGAARSSRTKRR